jgi:SSS family solute:Na+ symporter
MIGWVFLLVLGIYLTGMVLLGFVNRKVSSLSDFFLASRSLDSNSVGLTIGATVVGGSAVIVTCSLVYQFGLAGLWYDIGGIAGLLLLGKWLGPKVRATGAHSLPDLIGISYGKIGKVTSSLLLVAVEIGWVALLIQASNFIISTAVGTDSRLTLLLSASVIIAYTAIGGQMAVVKTDRIQIFMIVFALLAILFALLSKGATIQKSGLEFPTTKGFGPTLAISAFLMMFLSNLVGPDIYSKLFSAGSPKKAGRGALLGGSIRLLVSITVASIALLGLSVYGDEIAGGSLLPLAAMDMLPPLFSVLVLIGLLSIMLSSADSCLLSGATFVSWDLLEIENTHIRKIVIVVLGSLSYFLAIYSPGIISTLTLSYTVFSAGMVPAVIFSFWRRKLGLNRWGAVASFILGGSCVLILYALQNSGFYGGSLLFIPMFLSTLSLFLISWTASFMNRFRGRGSLAGATGRY